MTELSETILRDYQVRKSVRQKQDFIALIMPRICEMGYEVKTEKGSFGSRNILVGDPDRAKILFTAHYDTCARMFFPNFITPKSIPIYLLYNIVVVLGFFLISAAVGALFGFLFSAAVGALSAILVCYLLLIFMIFGPANRHTANDNTSGVITLLELMAALPPEKRREVAFVFFDWEEAGLIGSSSFAGKHRKSLKNTPVINFDCVSDGKAILFACSKKAGLLTDVLEDSFVPKGDYGVEVLSKGVFYPSDQMNFSLGVGVAALKRGQRTGVLYMDKIHTDQDRAFCRDNIAFLVEGSVRLCGRICSD